MISGPQTGNDRVGTFWAGAKPTRATTETASVSSLEEMSSDHDLRLRSRELIGKARQDFARRGKSAQIADFLAEAVQDARLGHAHGGDAIAPRIAERCSVAEIVRFRVYRSSAAFP